MKQFKDFLTEAHTAKVNANLGKLKPQTAGSLAIKPDGSELAHSIALNDSDVAYIKDGKVVITVIDKILGDAFTTTMSTDEFKILKKLK